MQKLRQKKNSLITVVLFGLVILSFIIWGGYHTDNVAPSALTTVNGEEISYQEFQRIFHGQMQAYGQAMGGGKPLSDSLAQLIERQVATGLVMQTAMAQQAKDLGIVIGDEELLKVLQDNKAFQDPEKNRFSPSIYTRVLEMNNIKPAQYEKAIRTDLASQRLRHLIESTVWVSDQELVDQQRVQNQKFNLDVAIYDADSLAKAGRIKTSPEALKAFYETHKGEFLSPARKQATIASLSQLDLEKNLTLSDAELKDFHSKTVAPSQDKKWTSIQAHAFHILFSDGTAKGQKEAEALKTQILAKAKGSSLLAAFKQAAAEKSEDYSNASKGGDLGYFDDKTMVKPFTEAIFKKSQTGVILGPIKTDFGHHLIFVEDLTNASKDFENRKKQIAFELRKQKSTDEMQRLQKTVADLLKKNASNTKEELKKMGFSIVESKPLDLQTRSPEAPFLLMQEILQSETGKWSEPKALQGSLYAYRVNEETKPQQQSFAEAEASVKRRLMATELERTVKTDYEALLSNKKTWSQLVKEGVEIKSTKDFKPFGSTQIPGAAESESALKAAQGLTAAASLSTPIAHEGKWILLKGSQFASTEMSLKPEELSKLRDDLLARKKMQVLNAFMDRIVKEARIPDPFRKKYNL